MKFKIILIILTLFFPSLCQGAVLFEDNFNSQTDWTIQQRTSEGSWTTCWPVSACANEPTGWDGYRDGMSWRDGNSNYGCTGGVGNNNFYINQYAGYPGATGSCYGGSGKCLSFWDESCSAYFEDSDGNLAKDLGVSYDDVYVRFRIKFKPNYLWMPTIPSGHNDASQHKFWHIQYYGGTGNPWTYFSGGSATKPRIVGGISYWQPGNAVYLYLGYGCEGTADGENCCSGTPSMTTNSNNCEDAQSLGTLTALRQPGQLFDGGWHTIEQRVKMNTNNGATFNADGIYTIWIDGAQKFNRTNMVWSKNGSVQSPRRGIRVISVGGNNNNVFQSTGCSGSDCEQWYAMDDVVISTTYVGPDYVIGGAVPLTGDLNNDHAVNIFDYNIFLANFGSAQCGNQADLDSNCNVNIFDYNVLLAHFGQTN